MQPQLAMPRTILAVDVEKFSDHARSDRQRVVVHDGLYRSLRRAFRDSGIQWDDCYHEDRGDGVMVLAPPSIPKILFSESLPSRLADALHRHNTTRPPEEHIRLRMALNTGEVFIGENGAVSSELNTSFRLLEAGRLKETLQNSAGTLAFIASSWFYYNVIQNGRGFRSEEYFPVLVDVKETRAVAWISAPGQRADQHMRDESWRIRLRDKDGIIHGPGILIRGRYALTSAHATERALGLQVRHADGQPAGQVWFDVPAKPEEGLRLAQVVWCSPAVNAAGDRVRPGIAGLSVVGPAIRGIGEPAWQVDTEPSPQIVQLRTFGAARDGVGEQRRWARLPDYGPDTGGQYPLTPLTEFSPDITSGCHGSDVIDERTGKILGIAETRHSGNSRDHMWVTNIGKIADSWPLMRQIAFHGSPGVPAEPRRPVCRSADILPLVDRCLQVPMLAQARLRHGMVSQLRADVLLLAPRSSVDRADLVALLWSCAQVPGTLAELAAKIRESSYGGKAAADLADDLERFQFALLPKLLP